MAVPTDANDERILKAGASRRRSAYCDLLGLALLLAPPLGQNSEFRTRWEGGFDETGGAMWIWCCTCTAVFLTMLLADFLPKNSSRGRNSPSSAAPTRRVHIRHSYRSPQQPACDRGHCVRWRAGGGARPDKVGGGIAGGAPCFWGERARPRFLVIHSIVPDAARVGRVGVGVWRKPRHEPTKAHPLPHGSARARQTVEWCASRCARDGRRAQRCTRARAPPLAHRPGGFLHPSPGNLFSTPRSSKLTRKLPLPFRHRRNVVERRVL